MARHWSDDEISMHIEYLEDSGQMNAAAMLAQLLWQKSKAVSALEHVLAEHGECDTASETIEYLLRGGE